MSTKIIISTSPEETRMGLVEDGSLKEYLVERSEETHLVGSIFLGKVCNVVSGIQAAFVDIGLDKNAFLYLGDTKEVTEGAKVLVQITKDARGTKGPTATREITIPGRYAVLFPKESYIGISRKISSSQERERLNRLATAAKPPDMGLVIRTVAEGVSDEAILADIKALADEWKIISAKMRISKAPVFLHRELDLSVRIVRDYFNKDVDKIVIDNLEVYKRLQALLEDLPQAARDKVEYHRGGEDVFASQGLTEAIESISDRRVELPSGGYLVVDYTEAMTVIDVNSGKYSGKATLEETVMQINKEAALAIAHLLRLRDIGGIIVVDFIDMHTQEHKQEILQALNKAFAGDKMRPKVQDITVLNLVEITRKKSRQNLAAVLYSPCPVCQGTGRVQSCETVALEIKRRIRGLQTKQRSAREILIVCHPLLADYIKQNLLRSWARELNCSLTVKGDATLHIEAFMLLDDSM